MNYADAISATQTATALAARTFGGPFAAGYVNFLLGQGSFVAQLADLGQKVEAGTATTSDYLDVFKSGGDILAGLGVLVAGTATSPMIGTALGIWSAIGVGLFIYKNKDAISDTWDGFGAQPYQWQTDLPLDFAAQIQKEAEAWLTPISQSCNRYTTDALNWVPPRRDPLVLDLDGGGITTSGINAAAPILFDQDGDGTLTATGWIGAGEAIVVRDLNGNGTIDSGRELFGDNTILATGPNAGQTAANGFEALANLDMDANGVADGKFDSNDVAYASVKLWKDLNQDGTSQAGELFTFDQLGVASINVSGTAQLAGSLLLANNNFYRQFTDDPALTVAVQTLVASRCKQECSYAG
jgi:hypothetical protein